MRSAIDRRTVPVAATRLAADVGPASHNPNALEHETGLALADFDVLAQLAKAHGELRTTELAERALISRSGMTRRVARLVDEGLVRRDRASTDARGVVVALSNAGIARRRDSARPRPRDLEAAR